MNTPRCFHAVLSGLFLSSAAFAGDAATSATAGSTRGGGNSAATATYDGRIGFARTDTRSGEVNAARGVAVGVDQNGLSLSVSTALATRLGPAVAANLNISIGRDGDVTGSSGLAVADGPASREATAGGQTRVARTGATSTAFGHANAPRGHARVITRSRSR